MARQTAKTVRTRIAPSPTGFPHIGTLYQALFNFAFAHKHNGQFVVRIEDTDRSRFVEGAEGVIFSMLDWANLTEDESPRKEGKVGPYRQSERLKIYHDHVQKLLDSGNAYFAYYPKKDAGVKKDYTQKTEVPVQNTVTPKPPKTLSEMPENGDWIVRMRVPKDRKISFTDGIRGEISFNPDQVTEQVLLKSDKFPTYHLAVVVDDHLMGITHVVRGEEWIPSTPKHVLLYQYFGWNLPQFFHTPDLRNPDKSKLSKRHGHTNVNWYKEEGYLPEAVLNYLALLGWTHPEEKEYFDLLEFISVFDLKDIRAVGPIFDLQKLTWLNGEHIRLLTDEKLKERLLIFDPSLKDLDQELVTQLVAIAKSRIKTLKEFKEQISPFLTPTKTETVNDKVIDQVKKDLENLKEWNKQAISEIVIQKYIMEKKIKLKDLYSLLIGQDRGLPLSDTFEVIGKEKTLALFNK